jgi:putative methyltransferase (TIGR04325 family)
MRLRDFVAPITNSALRRLRSGSGKKQYADYSQALNYCTEHGYENAAIVNVVVEKTKTFRDNFALNTTPVHLNATSAYSLCSLLATSGQNEINVLDFGGAAGAHYFLTRAVLAPTCKLNWIVVETPAMAEKARHILSCDELSFSSDLIEAASSLKQIDLLHTSGTLQCVDNPYDYLQRLISTSANHILFNRLGLTKGNHEVVTIHESWLSWNGPGTMPSGIADRKVSYPFVFPRESVFMEMLSAHYKTIMTFDDSSGIFPVDDEPITGFGLLVRRKA